MTMSSTRFGRQQALSAAIWALVRNHVAPDRLRLIKIQEAWERIVGPKVAVRTWPAVVSDGRVWVDVDGHQWLHELTYLRADMLRRLQAFWPSAQFVDLRLRAGVVPRRTRPQPTPTSTLAMPRFARELDAGTAAALTAVADPELRNILAGARASLAEGATR